MTGKDKRFPLSLASLGTRSPRAIDDRNAVRRSVATPQTATRNAASHGEREIPVTARERAPARTISNDRERDAPMISPAVRHAMVERVARQGVQDQKVLAALEAVPRHLFMEPGLASPAYNDASLPIGDHQTISQPYIVARMIEVMRANRHGGVMKRVLEIGTGCGYQAAVLAQVSGDVYSIERIKPLHELARANLRPMRVANIRLITEMVCSDFRKRPRSTASSLRPPAWKCRLHCSTTDYRRPPRRTRRRPAPDAATDRTRRIDRMD